MRLAIALAASLSLVGCGGEHPTSSHPAGTEGQGAGAGGSSATRHITLTLEFTSPAIPGGIDAGAGMQRIWVIETSETGSTQRVDIVDAAGPCRDTTPATPPPAGNPSALLLSAVCEGAGGARYELHHDHDELVLLHAAGTTGDAFDFDEIQRFPLPVGVAVLAAPSR